MGKIRREAFSDGVIAILITIQLDRMYADFQWKNRK
jgi:hypothetical protein